MRIVYCTDTVCYPGGIQTVTMVKANALAKIQENQVWIVVTDHTRPPLMYLDNVTLINLKINYYEDDWKGYWYVFKGFFQKRQLHKLRLQKLLNEIEPDVVISTGTSEKYFLPSLKVKSSPVYIREIHFAKNYRVLAADSLKERIAAFLSNIYDYDYRIRKYDKIVVLTKEDWKDNWNEDNKVKVIPNPVTAKITKKTDCHNMKVIAAGRLVQQKNFWSLINIWKRVIVVHPEWILEIWGAGGQEQMLKKHIVESGLEGKVFMRGFTANLYGEMATASMYLLTSEFEGFPLVLIEAMSVGLPVVSYACPTGPRDIIEDGENGFLVPLNDEMKFAEKVCMLIENETLRVHMGKKALLASEQYQIDIVIDKWMSLFHLLRDRKGI